MGVRRHQDLEVWQLARELERQVFAFIAEPHVRRDLDYCDQIKSSSRSAPRNIAEGFGRYLPRDFAHFVRIALGSLRENTDHLDAGLECKYLTLDRHAELALLANRATGAAVRLAKYLDGCKGKPPPPNPEP